MRRLLVRAQVALATGGVLCTLVGGVVLWKDKLGGKVLYSEKKTTAKVTKESKVYVVTGANSGIGKAVSFELARMGAKVYMACRDMDKCEEARREIVLATRNKYVYCRPCDLAKLASIRAFADQLGQREKRLDGLVCNAGVMAHPRAFSADGVEMHLAVNFLGHFLLVDLLSDALAAAAPSRVVYLMNPDYRKGQLDFEDLNMVNSKWDKSAAFTRSQLANMLAVTGLAEQLSPRGVIVNAVYPGVTATGIKRHMGVDKSLSAAVVANPLLWLLTKSPERGAQAPLYVLLDEEAANTTGALYSPQLKTMEVDEAARDPLTARRVLAVGRYWTGQAGSREEAARLDQHRTSTSQK